MSRSSQTTQSASTPDGKLPARPVRRLVRAIAGLGVMALVLGVIALCVSWYLVNLWMRENRSADELAKTQQVLAQKQQVILEQRDRISQSNSTEEAEGAGRSSGMVKPGEVPVNVEVPLPAAKAQPTAASPVQQRAALSSEVWLALGAVVGLGLLAVLVLLRRRALRLRRRANTLTPRTQLRRRPAHAEK